MKAIGGFLGLVLALGIGLFIYKTEFSSGPQSGVPPMQTIDTVGVQSDLLSIAQAERAYLAGHGSYATLDQLQQDGATVSDGSRRGYSYAVTVDDGQHFKVMAAPADQAKQSWPTLSIDDTMQVSKQ